MTVPYTTMCAVFKSTICPLHTTHCVSTLILCSFTDCSANVHSGAYRRVQGCSSAVSCSSGACMGAMTSFLPKPDHFQLYYLLYLDFQVGHQGGVTVTHMKQQKHGETQETSAQQGASGTHASLFEKSAAVQKFPAKEFKHFEISS